MNVRLVAAREFRQQVRSKAFKIATVLIMAAIVAAIVVPSLGGNEETPPRVAVVGQLSPGQKDVILAAGRLADPNVEVVLVSDQQAAEQALKAGDVDLAVVDGPGLVVNQPLGANSRLALLIGAISQRLQLQTQLEGLGLAPDQVTQVREAPALPLHSLEPPTPAGEDGSGVALLGALLLYILLLTYGNWVVAAVVHEKASRVVEVLLATVRPTDLVVGKVLGVGAVALGQGLLFAGAALGASLAVGFDTLPSGTPVAIASALLWLIVGFGFYSFAYATVGSLASRVEDAQSASLPLTALLVFASIAGSVAASSPDDALVRLLSFFPPTAPVVMSARVGAGGVAAWETPVAVAIVLVATYGMARLAAHIYPRVALHSGARLKWRAAWKSEPG